MLKKRYALPIAFLLVGIFLMGIPIAMATDGSGGSIDFDQTSVSDDTLVYIHFQDLDPSADYHVNYTGDSTDGYAFTTGSDQDDIYIPITFEKPAGTNAFTIYLRAGLTNGSILDQITVFVTEPESILNTAAFLAIVIPLLIFAIIVAIYKSVGKGAKT